jgi:hypothetical protein
MIRRGTPNLLGFMTLLALIAFGTTACAGAGGDASSRSGILPLRGSQSRAEPPKRLEAASTSEARAGTPRSFDWDRDTFCFSNETLWAYDVDASGAMVIRKRETPPQYSRRCFVLVRAALQFHKFARFDPQQPKVSDAEYAKLVSRVARVPVWWPQGGRRIVIPGYADLRSFSKEHAKTLQDRLGAWWPVYLRFGNWRLSMPFPRPWQTKFAHELTRKIDAGQIQAVLLTRWRTTGHTSKLNHCMIVYSYEPSRAGYVFHAYDPNDATRPRAFSFDAKTSSFMLDRTSYFNGGRVNATKAYVSPWQ